jgi:Sigma-70 region 2
MSTATATKTARKSKKDPRFVPLTKRQQKLAADPEAIALAERIAGRYIRRSSGNLEDEIRSAAYLALVFAARRYSTRHGIPFTAYLGLRVHGEIKSAFRRERFALSLDLESPNGGGSLAELVPFNLEAGGF